MSLNNYIDHTLLKATATSSDIKRLCEEAITHNFYAVCVNSAYASLAKDHLKNTGVKLAVIIGFPLGATSIQGKIAEAEQAVLDGAQEIDLVINIGFLKDGRNREVVSEISTIKKAIGNKTLKVILETCYLTEIEIKKACELVMEAGADFVKTSTGFGTRGASFRDIELFKEVVGDKLKIKASGGIRDAKTATAYIKRGVSRIGTSSGIQIITQNSEEL